MYETIVGEMGFSRHDFLYNVDFWEARRLFRGFRKRDRFKHQLIAECAYAATFAMRDPKGTTVSDIFPDLFNDDSTNNLPSEDEIGEMLEIMKEENAKNTKEGA